MNERQLRSFIKAAELGSFSRAAADSYITTPAFVQQINLLEESLGFRLFRRHKRGIELTESGTVFYETACQIIKLYEDAKKKCISLQEAEEMTIRIGCPPEQFPNFVTDSCRFFRKAHPQAQVQFISSTLPLHLQDLRCGKIDLCFMAEPDPSQLDGLKFHALCDEHFSFCMRGDHPLSQKKALTEDDICRFPVLCGTYDFLKKPMEDFLPEKAQVIKLSAEYDITTQSRIMLSDELIMIHSHWTNCYLNVLNVIPTSISAGRIGAISRSPSNQIVNHFISCISL